MSLGYISAVERIDEIRSFISKRIENAEKEAIKDQQATMIIQSAFRAHRIRKFIRNMVDSALCIQRVYRGYRARNRVRRIKALFAYLQRMYAYNQAAIVIQKAFRGFYIRKYVMDFYRRKGYIKMTAEASHRINEMADTLKKIREADTAELRRKEEIGKLQDHATHMHFLTSTKSIPGIYAAPMLKDTLPSEFRSSQKEPLNCR
eukprot:gnl/Carplike_NY0171/9419_a13151_215.p1 GENE.gnl/Carplike_NY0171/9419_a13151_215~~gnl/Carplike_NY0171/9419_a13151_215.p1  ORF type:complete len:204 (-),score=25.86 gnl/Carplike_NY0171/9419_a13151_215:29-640(-)